MFLVERDGKIYMFTWKVVDWNIYVSNGKRQENLHVYMERNINLESTS